MSTQESQKFSIVFGITTPILPQYNPNLTLNPTPEQSYSSGNYYLTEHSVSPCRLCSIACLRALLSKQPLCQRDRDLLVVSRECGNKVYRGYIGIIGFRVEGLGLYYIGIIQGLHSLFPTGKNQ